MGAAENDIKRLVIEAIRVKELVGETELPKEEKADIEFATRPLPEGSVSFSELLRYYELNDWQGSEYFGKAVEYVSNRKVNITADDVDKYEFYLTPETAYNLHKRVLIPMYWKGELKGYTARAIDADVKPKFHSSYEPNFVFNVDRQLKDSKFVIVCEGPFDAMAIDGVAILGSQVSEVQADIIDSLGKEVIVVPDFDYEEYRGKTRWAGKSLIDSALEYGWNVSFPVWSDKCKDINEAVQMYGKLFVIKSIIDSKESTSLKIKLLSKR